MQLTQKETGLLKDLQTQEKLCIQKYSESASKAKDPQLKNLFTDLSQTEQRHLDTINQIAAGNPPQAQSGANNQQMPTFNATYSTDNTPDKQNDCFLCNDLLTAEKHASHLYDTCIFEFTDENTRKVLNGIQTQEQNHGKSIYDYMSANSMY